MMCHKIGMPPISTIGLGRISVSSARRVPNPPASIPTFIRSSDDCLLPLRRAALTKPHNRHWPVASAKCVKVGLKIRQCPENRGSLSKVDKTHGGRSRQMIPGGTDRRDPRGDPFQSGLADV